MHPIGNGYVSSVGGRPLPTESTSYELVFLELTVKVIDSWIRLFNKYYLWQTTMYDDNMSELFNNITVTIT